MPPVERYKPRRQRATFFQFLKNRPRPSRDSVAFDPFTVDDKLHPPGVVPDGAGLAQDNAFCAPNAPQQWAAASLAAGAAINSAFFEGQAFPGYAYLAELAQRPEYRRISEVIATEMTRKWIQIQSISEEEEDLDGDDDLDDGGDTEEQHNPDEENERADAELHAGDLAPPSSGGGAAPKQRPGMGAGAEESEEDGDAEEAEKEKAIKAGKAKNKRIKELNDELDRLKVKEAFTKIAAYDGFMGRSHLYLDTGSTDDRAELKTSIGNGRSPESKAKFFGKKGFLQALIPVEAVWVYPTNYDSNDPLSPNWYNPESWYVMGKEVHKTRLLRFIGREVPDLLKPAYSFGGLSLSQMCKPYVDNWLRTRQSVADIISAFSVFVLGTDLSTLLEPSGPGGPGGIAERVTMFNDFRDNKGVMVIDKETEEFQNVSAPLGGLDNLQAQTQEHICSISGIPVVKYCGIQPAGLNASSEGEIRVFYDCILAYQEHLFRAHLTTVIDFVMLSLWGEVDQDITFKFEPLWSLDEKSLAEVREIDARTGTSLIQAGVLAPEEDRQRVAADPESPYSAIDVEDVPDLKEEEQEGLGEAGQGGQGKGPSLYGGESEGGFGSGGKDELSAALKPIIRPDGTTYRPRTPPFLRAGAADRFRRPYKGGK